MTRFECHDVPIPTSCSSQSTVQRIPYTLQSIHAPLNYVTATDQVFRDSVRFWEPDTGLAILYPRTIRVLVDDWRCSGRRTVLIKNYRLGRNSGFLGFRNSSALQVPKSKVLIVSHDTSRLQKNGVKQIVSLAYMDLRQEADSNLVKFRIPLTFIKDLAFASPLICGRLILHSHTTFWVVYPCWPFGWNRSF